jgi:hypothetical protein
MLRRKGGDSHVIQAEMQPLEVTQSGLFETAHRWAALAAFPLALGQRF